MNTTEDIQKDAINLFNQSSIADRKDICLRMIETFDERERIDLIDEINKRNVPLRMKSVHDRELSLTQQLLLLQNHPKKYIESRITPYLKHDT